MSRLGRSQSLTVDIRVCPALAALCESDQNQETSVPISKFKFTLLTCIYPKDAPTRGIGSAPLRSPTPGSVPTPGRLKVLNPAPQPSPVPSPVLSAACSKPGCWTLRPSPTFSKCPTGNALTNVPPGPATTPHRQVCHPHEVVPTSQTWLQLHPLLLLLTQAPHQVRGQLLRDQQFHTLSITIQT